MVMITLMEQRSEQMIKVMNDEWEVGHGDDSMATYRYLWYAKNVSPAKVAMAKIENAIIAPGLLAASSTICLFVVLTVVKTFIIILYVIGKKSKILNFWLILEKLGFQFRLR